MKPGWYLRRLRRMSAREVAARSTVAARQWWWAKPARRPGLLATVLPGPRRARCTLQIAQRPQGDAANAVVQAAEALLQGEWRVFHLLLTGIAAEPDWFRDPLTGIRAPSNAYCFDIAYRDEAAVGNIKFVWELSRHQPATLLACAWWLTGDERFADRAAAHLVSWWDANPFLQGVHWVSGIEVGLRLLSWTWIRALLGDWRGAPALFEDNETFVGQAYAHSRYLSAFHSSGSSANNHLIAEFAGLAAASVAFPWFAESARWAKTAQAGLAREAAAQTHGDGWNREQASAYHLFVAEMLLAVALPARMAGGRFANIEDTLRRMLDALAASLDQTGQPPRFGDADDARGLLVDAPGANPDAALLDAGRVLFGAAPWWPASTGSVLGSIAASLQNETQAERPVPRPALFEDAGIAILRAGDIWLRCDAGPHGYRSIAAHGHADALSAELRYAGVEVLADPGTYCYHGEPEWRSLFRGTRGHNTLTIADTDQAASGGPFLWLTHPQSTLEEWEPDRVWQASHDGYRHTLHRRRVTLTAPYVMVQDWIEAPGPRAVLLAFHLGPAVQATLQGRNARLEWCGGSARVALPPSLAWQMHRCEQNPPFGWYSAAFGHRQPTTTLAGRGTLPPGTVLESRFTLAAKKG